MASVLDEAEFNPFAAPEVTIAAEGETPGASGFDPDSSLVWRDGKELVMRVGTPLPNRCLRCNREADGVTLTRKYVWHAPWIYVFVILNLFLYFIIALCVRKKARVTLGLCKAHNFQRRAAIRNGWLVSLVGLALIALGLVVQSAVPAVIGVFLIPVGLYVGSKFSTLLTPKRIDLDFARFTGAGEPYLANFRNWGR